MLRWGSPPLPSLSVSPAVLLHLLLSAPSSRPLCLSPLPLPFIPPPWYRPKSRPRANGILRPQHPLRPQPGLGTRRPV